MRVIFLLMLVRWGLHCSIVDIVDITKINDQRRSICEVRRAANLVRNVCECD